MDGALKDGNTACACQFTKVISVAQTLFADASVPTDSSLVIRIPLTRGGLIPDKVPLEDIHG